LKSLPLYKFIDAYCNENISVIVIEGEAPSEVVQSTWDSIYTQYIEAIGGEDLSDKINKIWEISSISNKIEKLSAIIDVMNVYPTEELYNMFFTFGYMLPDLPYNEANVARIIKAVSGYIKRDIAEIQRLEQTLDVEKQGNKPSEEEFYKLIVAISEHFKMVINENEISTMAFAMYVHRYKVAMHQLEIQKNKVTE
jgi:hypothetical protein